MTSSTRKITAIRPQKETDENFDKLYFEKAADEAAEQEALEWSEAMIQDIGEKED